MTNKKQYKRNHHILPKLYLKGFVQKENEPFIWVYTRGKIYNPGKQRSKNNPYLGSINKEGAQKDYYAYTDANGHRIFDDIENVLEQKEKPSNSVFEKIRRQEMISSDEKAIFSSYLTMMIKRVPARKERANREWPEFFKEFGHRDIDQIIRTLDKMLTETDSNNNESRERLLRKRAEAEKTLEKYQAQKNIPEEIHLKSMVQPSPFGDFAIRNMNWHFLISPKDKMFIAGDNPVFFCEKKGLNYSDLSFPISTNVALVASPRNKLPEGFYTADIDDIEEINRRAIKVSTQHIYSSRNEKWIANMLNKDKDKIRWRVF